MGTNYYAVLELDQDATAEEIRQNYRRLALRYHPDKAGPEGAAKFKEIAAAYAVLNDPSKKAMYDRCGAAGLDAMDNPVAAKMGDEFGMNRVMGATVLLLTLQLVLILLFLALLAAFVDGHMTSATYVKVFAPLFVVDVFVVLLAFVLPCIVVIYGGGGNVTLSMFALFILCAVVLTVVVPVAKDRNEARRAAGRDDWLRWRVWLIPAYVLVVCFAAMKVLPLTRLKHERAELRAAGMIFSSRFIYISAALHVVQIVCATVLVALVACRADNVITVSYFAVIGVPFYVYAMCDIVDSFLTNLFTAFVCRWEEGDATGAHEAVDSSNVDGVTRTDDAHKTAANKRQEQDEATSTIHSGRPVFVRAYLSIIFTSAALHVLGWGLVLACVSMLCVRLDHYTRHGTYIGVLSLAKALIPLYLIVGVGVVFGIVVAVQMCVWLDIGGPGTDDGEDEGAGDNPHRGGSDAAVQDESPAHSSATFTRREEDRTGDAMPQLSREADCAPTVPSAEEEQHVAVSESLSNVD